MGQGKYEKEDGGGSVFVLLVILVPIVGIVAAAGMIMAVLNYNRENTTPVQVNLEGSGSGGYEEKYDGSPGGNTHGSSYGSSTPKDVTSYGHYDESVWNFNWQILTCGWFTCDSLVMRRDSYLKNWWDPAYEKLVKSREYREICEDIDDPEVHGWKSGSSAAETCFNY